ncbi:hypothetical protein ACFSQE_01175 [Vogesella fluminis]|uniref:Uncharacterized protein n=1 Tax=Vogesella fluminis TaxID=1069161 RepID=A0ABQ3HC06_9NEIS|nr:hypothetical protein [Vogesella fluminis]GHD81392.1 hypothetical protein GCM10011419_27240 [Vogesella fluminis]
MAQPHNPEPLDGHVRRIVAWLDTNRREAFEERAAIAQYDGNLDQEQAERLACLDILATYGLPYPVQLLQVEMAGSTDWVLTTDVESARSRLSELGGRHIVEVSVDDTVQCQFGDLAVLGTAPW